MNTDNQSYGDLSTCGEVRFVRILPGPIERVWQYLTDPEKRGLWLARGTTDLRVGGKVMLEFYNTKISEAGDIIPEKYREDCQDGCNFTGTILRCEPPYVYSHNWGGPESEVTYELSEVGDNVQLVLTHRKLGDDKDQLISVSAGWHTHVDILSAKLEGSQPPSFWSRHTLLEKEYEAKLQE